MNKKLTQKTKKGQPVKGKTRSNGSKRKKVNCYLKLQALHEKPEIQTAEGTEVFLQH